MKYDKIARHLLSINDRVYVDSKFSSQYLSVYFCSTCAAMEISGTQLKDVTLKRKDKLCEPCKGENESRNSDGFCKDCEEYMCNTCFGHHLKGKLCRNHVMVDGGLSSVLSMPGHKKTAVKCKQHDGETVKLYCRKHEAVGCGECMLFDHKRCHNEYIDIASKDFHLSQDFQTLMSKTEHLTSFNTRSETKIQEIKRSNQSSLEKALGDIRQFRNDFNEYLDKMEANVINEANTIMSENDTMLVKLEKDCELLSTKIENTKQMLNVEYFQDNELFINTVETKKTVIEIEKEIAEIQSKRFKKFDFSPDQQLRSLITSTHRFGQMVTTLLAVIPKDIQKTQSKSETVCAKKDAGKKSAGTVTVGTQVQNCWKGRTGDRTVTAVHDDGTVTVKWDSTGKESRWEFIYLTIIE